MVKDLDSLRISFICVLFSLVLGKAASFTFYPFGTATGDQKLARRDDAFTQVSISFDFPFFGNIYRQLYISTNGIITVGSGVSDYVPRPFPLATIRGVAAYWTDSDPSRGGDIFYREDFNSQILHQITSDIRSRFIQHGTFSSTWALIVTFSNVSAYGCGNDGGTCQSTCNAVVNHQTILTSNGINSFAIFLYNRLDYTVGTASCNGHAQIGFNAGDGKRFYLVESSNTLNIKTVALQKSNVGIPSKWMFSIGEDISGVCNTRGLLAVSPRKVFYFGNQNVSITGPCFTASNIAVYVNVFFDQIPVQCVVSDGFQLTCRVPFLNTVGRIPIAFQYQNSTFNSFLISVGLDDSMVSDSDITSIEIDPDSPVPVIWDPAVFPSPTNITIAGYQNDIYINASGGVETTLNASLTFINIANSGRIDIMPSVLVSYTSRQLYRQLMLIINRQIVRFSVMMSVAISQTYCRSWYNSQPSQSELARIVDEVSRRSPCPPMIFPNSINQIINFKIDASCNPNNPRMCAFFHQGATVCYRSTNNGGGHAAQCCYNARNELILGSAAGGGNLVWVNPDFNISRHLLLDVSPYIACCKLSSLCSLYYEKRPSINSLYYVPPRPTRANGDPHFTTIDGTSFDFNPIGEFVYFKGEGDEIQARISQYVSSTGLRADACYFSAFAFKSNHSDSVQVELNALHTFTVRVNGTILTLDQGSFDLGNVYLTLVNNATLDVQIGTGIYFEVIILNKMLQIIVSVPHNLKGKVSGLMGNWDDNPENDLMRPDGTCIPRNSSKSDIHFNFGMKWSTTNQSSLFSYPDGLTWNDFQNPSFRPDFSEPPPNPICGSNAACLYDAYVTGDDNIGLSNIVMRNRTQDIVSLYDSISSPDSTTSNLNPPTSSPGIWFNYTCSSQVTLPNADVTINNDPDTGSVHYSVRCYLGFRLIGSGDVTCIRGTYTSSFGVCSGAFSALRSSLKFVSMIIVVVHLLGLI